MYLRCSVQENPKEWKKWLPLAELWYNSLMHSSTGMSPFKALYGHEPNLGAMPTVTEDTNLSVSTLLTDKATQLQRLKINLVAAQNRTKMKADKHRTKKEFQVGEKVLLKLQPYVQNSVVRRPYPKLVYKYFGPFEILAGVGEVAYKLNHQKGAWCIRCFTCHNSRNIAQITLWYSQT